METERLFGRKLIWYKKLVYIIISCLFTILIICDRNLPKKSFNLKPHCQMQIWMGKEIFGQISQTNQWKLHQNQFEPIKTKSKFLSHRQRTLRKILKNFHKYFRVKDLTKTWHDIVQNTSDRPQQDESKQKTFLEYYSRINVSEMSGMYFSNV